MLRFLFISCVNLFHAAAVAAASETQRCFGGTCSAQSIEQHQDAIALMQTLMTTKVTAQKVAAEANKMPKKHVDKHRSGETCRGAWPLFKTSADLQASPWAAYLKTVYGELPQENAFPICMGDFWSFYQRELKDAGVTLPSSQNGCPAEAKTQSFFVSTPREHAEPPYFAVTVYHFGPFQPLKAHTWVEVFHRARTVSSGFERHGAWFGYSPGSGIWTNTGKTIVFNTHDEAFHHFGAKWENDLAQKAKTRGWDTIQFLKGDGVSTDACCEKLSLGPCCHSLEFVATKLTGIYGCTDTAGGQALRAGWQASRPCHCQENADMNSTALDTYVSYINCRGVPGKFAEADERPRRIPGSQEVQQLRKQIHELSSKL